MGMPAAKQGDQVTATDTHDIVTPPGPTVPVAHPFSGTLDGNLSSNVQIMGQAAATVGTTAMARPPHVPIGGTFARQPAGRGTVAAGSTTVFINNKPAARSGDPVTTCNDPVDLPAGKIIATGSVLIGGGP